MIDGMPVWFVFLGLVTIVFIVNFFRVATLAAIRVLFVIYDAISNAIFDYRVRTGDIPYPYRAFYNQE